MINKPNYGKATYAKAVPSYEKFYEKDDSIYYPKSDEKDVYVNGVYTHDEPKKESYGSDIYYPTESDLKHDMYANGVYSHEEPKKEYFGSDDSLYYPKIDDNLYANGVYSYDEPKKDFGNDDTIYYPIDDHMYANGVYSYDEPKKDFGHDDSIYYPKSDDIYANGVYSYDEPKKEAIGYDDSIYYPQPEMDYKHYDMYDGVYNHYVPDKKSYGSDYVNHDDIESQYPKEQDYDYTYGNTYEPSSEAGLYM